VNIALVTETYPPEINGVAMTLHQLAEGLRARGHSTQVVRPRQRGEPGPLIDRPDLATARGLPIPRYPQLRFGLPCAGRLARSWRRCRPDLVHVATEGPLGLSALGAARRLGLPTLSTFHTNFHSYSRHYNAAPLARPVFAYLRWFHNRTGGTLVPTPELAADLERRGFRNVGVLGRGVRGEIFRPEARDAALRRRWGSPSQAAPVIVHVGRLAEEKNYRLLFKAYRHIRDARPDARFVVVGDGPARRRYERAHPWVRFEGAIPLEFREELARRYASADIFLFPSLTETYGNVLVEAMACGNAVVAFDDAAAKLHMADGRNGLKADKGDENGFIRAALRLAGDALLRRRLGEAATSVAQALDWKPVLDRFESALASAAARSAS